MKKPRVLLKSAVALMCVVAVSAVGAPPASADGVNLIANDPSGEYWDPWSGGCTIKYYVDDTGIKEWVNPIKDGNARIQEVTGITFTRTMTLSEADVVIKKMPEKNYGPYGYASSPNDIALSPVSELSPEHRTARYLESIAVHEMLHVLGLAHDKDEQTPPPDEIMYPHVSPWYESNVFGKGDIAGMNFIAAKNGCAANASDFIPGTPTTSMVGRVPKFGPKRVKLIVPGRSVYNVKTGKTTVVVTGKTWNGLAKSDGQRTWIKSGSEWVLVPYVYKPRIGVLSYNEAMRLRLGLPLQVNTSDLYTREFLTPAQPRYIGRR